jgi:long-chain acyl-CoA synthetase
LEHSLQTLPEFSSDRRKNGDRVALRTKELGLWHDISWRAVLSPGALRRVRAGISMGLEKGDHACHHRRQLSRMGVWPIWVFSVPEGYRWGFMPPMPGSRWNMSSYHSVMQVLLFGKRRAIRQMAHFREQTPKLQKVIVWDTEGLREFKDPMVITFEDLVEKGDQPHFSESAGLKFLKNGMTDRSHAEDTCGDHLYIGHHRTAQRGHADPSPTSPGWRMR